MEGDQRRVSVSYKNLSNELQIGDEILVNNGLLAFRVVQKSSTELLTEVTTGGVLTNNKSMSFPGRVLQQEYLSEQDKQDLLFGIEQDVDFIACSFVSCAEDLKAVNTFLSQNGARGKIDVIAKIENRSGVDHIEEIFERCDGIMIARGDMGVEVPFEELPQIQKKLITKCRLLGKRVITATEMLESMIHNIRPTRAEISDVANAVYDGTSAVMLSGETAVGLNPVLAVEVMARIVKKAERGIDYNRRFAHEEFQIYNVVDAISHATCGMAIDVEAKAIVVCTLSGMTARMISRFRPQASILALTTSEKNRRKLALSWGALLR